MKEDNLTTEHELFLSIGLNVPMKPSVFKQKIDALLFENLGYMNSWGTHTKHEYIDIYMSLEEKLNKITTTLNWIKSKFEEEWTYEAGTGEVVESIIQRLESDLKTQ